MTNMKVLSKLKFAYILNGFNSSKFNRSNFNSSNQKFIKCRRHVLKITKHKYCKMSINLYFSF